MNNLIHHGQPALIFCLYLFYYILSRGEESHDKDCSSKCPEGGFIGTQKGKKVTNRCRSALVQSVLSSLVLVQGARARARWRLSGHMLLSTGGVKR